MLIKRIIIVPVALFAFIWGSWLAAGPHHDPGDGTPEIVRPGVIHRFIIKRLGPWRIHVLEIDLRRTELELGTARANDRYFGRETVSSMAARKSTENRPVIAALNGDYFNPATGEGQNNHMTGGVFVKAFASPGVRPEYVDIPNSQFAFSSTRRPSIDQYMFDGYILTHNHHPLPLSGVNVIPRRGGMTLFNSYFGDAAPVLRPADSSSQLSLSVVAHRGDTLVTISGGNASASGGLSLAGEGIVLGAYRSIARAFLEECNDYDTVRLVLSLRPRNGGIVELLGGWPRLVRDGRSVFAIPGFPENPEAPVFAKRHPRSGIGFSRDGTKLFFIAVDGRHKNTVGMSLPEFADLMVSLGIHQGLNLDGGGSTTMLIDGEVVNSPSDLTGERPVANCLLLFERLHPGASSTGPIATH